MQVVVDQIVPTSKAVFLSTVIRYADGGPVRFLQVELPWELFTTEVRTELLHAFNRLRDSYLDDEPLFDSVTGPL